MDKRYQVFVSSTFADLKDERRRVIQTLMEMDCIPAGMELFPAADEEQWTFIRRIIDDCDYYLLIIGGRYGSITADGISYTEKEYDYAVSRDMKVIAILHEKPQEIPVGKSDIDPELRGKLERFREKVGQGRLVRFWAQPSDLPGIVALSLTKTIKTHPAIGWMRANAIANADVLGQINLLRQENEKLKAQVAEARPPTSVVLPDIAGLDETFVIRGHSSTQHGRRDWTAKLSWRQIFSLIAPYLIKVLHENAVKSELRDSVTKIAYPSGYSPAIEDQDFQTVAVQLKALGLVKIQYLQAADNTMALFWSLTGEGERMLIETRVIRTRAGDA